MIGSKGDKIGDNIKIVSFAYFCCYFFANRFNAVRPDVAGNFNQLAASPLDDGIPASSVQQVQFPALFQNMLRDCRAYGAGSPNK